MDDNINTTLNYISLAEEIIIFAAKDYRKALRVLKKHPNNETALRRKNEVERFFRSEWFTVLSKLDPDLLIKRLKEEAEI